MSKNNTISMAVNNKIPRDLRRMAKSHEVGDVTNHNYIVAYRNYDPLSAAPEPIDIDDITNEWTSMNWRIKTEHLPTKPKYMEKFELFIASLISHQANAIINLFQVS